MYRNKRRDQEETKNYEKPIKNKNKKKKRKRNDQNHQN